jgi:mono/diheme cytochrome c family protein
VLGVVGTLWLGCLAGQAAPEAQQVPVPDQAPRTGGAYWYARLCIGCHGGRGEGTIIGAALVGRPDGPLSPELFLSRVRQPLLIMPDFPADVVPDARVQEIAVYLRSLEPAP